MNEKKKTTTRILTLFVCAAVFHPADSLVLIK